MRKMHIDIETYSSIDLKTSGIYRYVDSLDFEILIFCYSFGNEVITVRLALGEEIPKEAVDAMNDSTVLKLAHNAMFERVCLRSIGYNIPPNQWECTAVKAAYCGLPLGLESVSNALNLGDKAKSTAGKNLIKYFSIPTKLRNGTFKRNMPQDNVQLYEEFCDYCVQDVVAEMEVDHVLGQYNVCQFERNNYFLDQKINDYGIKVDVDLATAAYKLDTEFVNKCKTYLKDITGLENPNSPSQLVKFINEAQDKIKITSVAKDKLEVLLKTAEGVVLDVLNTRKLMSKTSVKKYTAMLNAICSDGRIRGLFQFYGANKTGRYAGRLVQLQNLPVNKMDDLDTARVLTKMNDLEILEMVYSNIQSVLSQLVRTALVAEEGETFAVSDFSAIEARVLSWLASESWRMEVFATHGKIYEAAAAKMFNVPIELVTKSSDYRMRAKNGELALGYQGALGAMVRMAGPKTTLTKEDMLSIIKIWRKTNPKIVKLWDDMNECAIYAVSEKTKVETGYRGVSFEFDGKVMRMNLPSGRSISYFEAHLITNKFGSTAIAYKNIDQVTKKWCDTETYGGKLVENAVQAISRDILVNSMANLDNAGFKINMHVHDEIICEVPIELGEQKLKEMEDIMKLEIPWAKDLVLGAEGYVTEYYKKD